MEKRNYSNIFIFILLIFYIIIYKLFIFTSFLKYSESITSAFIICLFGVSCLLFGYSKSKLNPFKKSVTVFVLTVIIVFFSLSYMYGLVGGFLKNSYSLKLVNIFNNMLFPIITIIFSELLRYNIIRANKDKKWVIYILTILLSVFEVVISVRKIMFYSIEYTFKVITSVILPIISKNITFSFLDYNIGYQPNMIYRLIMESYVYFAPIMPNFSDYINSMIGIILPIFLYLYVARMIDEYDNGIKKEFVKNSFQALDVPTLVIIVVLVCLISKAFPYYITGIGSGSMTGSIYKGDAVIVFKETDENKIHVGDVIVYKHDNKTIIHRLVEIKENNGIKYYITKGDANNSNDNVLLTFKDIEGKICLNIRYIGYPSVWISELFS